MKTESARYIIGANPLLEIPDTLVQPQGKRKYTKRRGSIQLSSEKTVSPVTTSLYGFTIQPMTNLGQKRPEKGSFWQAVLGTLQVGQGFEVAKKDYNRAQKAVQKYNKLAKSIWKSARKFVFESGMNAQGEPDANMGRVGRIQ